MCRWRWDVRVCELQVRHEGVNGFRQDYAIVW